MQSATRRVLTVNEACAYLGISRRTLYRLFADGSLEWVKPSRGRRGVRADELERHLDATTARSA